MALCSTCFKDKSVSDFYYRIDRPLGRWSRCKKCVSEKRKTRQWTNAARDNLLSYRRKYYQKNKEKHHQYNKQRYHSDPRVREATKIRSTRRRLADLNNRKFIISIKNHPCLDCGIKFHHVAMDFDHRHGEIKGYEISRMRNCSKATILKEVAKCDLVCSNCHRVRTWKRKHGEL